MQPRTETVTRKFIVLLMVLFLPFGCRYAVDEKVDEVVPKIKVGMTLSAATRAVGREPDDTEKLLFDHPVHGSDPYQDHAVWNCADGKVDAYIFNDKIESVNITRYP